MGGTCCKKLDSPMSPKLHMCEVLRRCARQMCPLDPVVQKPVSRTRKYGLSDIVGPVVKKDSWAQTDPQPPPRRRRKKYKRRRSRSVDFLPYLLKDSMKTTGSLGNISGQEDVIDFQMFFMSRLPRNPESNTSDDGKDDISGRKKVFLSGLLGEENNNLPSLVGIQSHSPETSTQLHTGQEIEPVVGTNSRKSSITESLKEFESSLLDMLQDIGDEEEDTKLGLSKEVEDQGLLSLQLKAKEMELSPLKEKKDDLYILTPLEEEDEESIWKVNKLTIDEEMVQMKKDVSEVLALEDNDKQKKMEENKDESKKNAQCVHEDKRSDKPNNIEPPIITIETVS